MEQTSLLIDHPLLQRYMKNQGIQHFTADTKFPLGLLSIIYEDYTGQKVGFRSQTGGAAGCSQLMVPFQDIFSPDLDA